MSADNRYPNEESGGNVRAQSVNHRNLNPMHGSEVSIQPQVSKLVEAKIKSVIIYGFFGCLN